MLDNLPLVAKITVWICIAHLWIIVCTLVYVKHEGLTTHKHNNIGNVSVATFPVSQSELVSQILTDPELNFSDLKILPSRKLEFQKEFERRWRANKKFAVLKQFKDVSKTYVFVLLSHAGIGMSSLNQVKNPAV